MGFRGEIGALSVPNFTTLPCCLATIKAGMQESTLPWLPSEGSRSIQGARWGGPVGFCTFQSIHLFGAKNDDLVVEVEVWNPQNNSWGFYPPKWMVVLIMVPNPIKTNGMIWGVNTHYFWRATPPYFFIFTSYTWNFHLNPFLAEHRILGLKNRRSQMLSASTLAPTTLEKRGKSMGKKSGPNQTAKTPAVSPK